MEMPQKISTDHAEQKNDLTGREKRNVIRIIINELKTSAVDNAKDLERYKRIHSLMLKPFEMFSGLMIFIAASQKKTTDNWN